MPCWARGFPVEGTGDKPALGTVLAASTGHRDTAGPAGKWGWHSCAQDPAPLLGCGAGTDGCPEVPAPVTSLLSLAVTSEQIEHLHRRFKQLSQDQLTIRYGNSSPTGIPAPWGFPSHCNPCPKAIPIPLQFQSQYQHLPLRCPEVPIQGWNSECPSQPPPAMLLQRGLANIPRKNTQRQWPQSRGTPDKLLIAPSFNLSFGDPSREGCSCSCPCSWWLCRELCTLGELQAPAAPLLPGVISWFVCFVNHGEQQCPAQAQHEAEGRVDSRISLLCLVEPCLKPFFLGKL